MPGPGHKPHGPRPKIKNPGKLFSRLMQFIMKNYGLHLVIVFICIIVSVIGSAAGILSGYGIALAVNENYIIRPDVIAVSIMISAVIGMLSGSYPAYKAAKMRPVDALRQ